MSTTDDPDEGDWRGALAQLQQLHTRLLTMAEALRADLARPPAMWTVVGDPGQAEGRLGLGRLSEAERAALDASVEADLQMLRQLTERLEQLRVTLDRFRCPNRRCVRRTFAE